MNWKAFSFGEGLTKTASSIFQKLVGNVMGTVSMGCLAGIIIGMVQMASGLVGFIAKNRETKDFRSIFPDTRTVMWALLFGFFAAIPGTVLSIYTFTLGADMGIRTLLIMGSVVPGAIVGKIFWGDALGFRQILGIGVFLIALWAMIDFPSLSALLMLPLWMWLTLVITCTQVFNEMLSRLASVKLDPWANNFWVGCSTVVSCLTLLLGIAFLGGGVTLSIGTTFVWGTVVIAGIVVVMISFKLLAYKLGGSIALKKIIMQGTYLVTAAVAGIIIYNEPLTIGKVVGITLFFVSFFISDKEAWKIFLPKHKLA